MVLLHVLMLFVSVGVGVFDGGVVGSGDICVLIVVRGVGGVG